MTTTSNQYNLPISIKGIVFDNGKIWLRKNERGEWELPGGKIDPGEQPSETVVRELKEELGFDTETVKIIDVHIYTINIQHKNNTVLVITYLCKLVSKTGQFEEFGESGKTEFQAFSMSEVNKLNMPEFYKNSITKLGPG
jgi:mutator protein MutT